MSKPATPPAPPRILVIANKSWEADPLVNVLLSDRTRPGSLKDFVAVSHPLIRPPGYADPDPPAKPRITFRTGGASIEVWCIQDLMNPKVSGSSSAEKARVLPRALAGKPTALVIAFGTAGFPDSANLNGSVVIGSRCLVHDPPTKEATRYAPKLKDAMTATSLPTGFFRNIDAEVRFPAEARFLLPPINPARPPLILAGHNWISLGSVNVTNYDDYVWTDEETIAAFKVLDPKTTAGRIGSMETTHGNFVGSLSSRMILFVSGITDTVPYFDIQVTPRVYAQNFVAAHNAGVALAWLIPEVVAQLGLGAVKP